MGKKLFIAMIVIISTITLGILLYSKSGEIEILKENNNQKTIKEIRIERAIEEAKNKQEVKSPKGIQVFAKFKSGRENSGYAKSDNYCFSLRIGSRENGKYYNVFRNANDGVSNHEAEGLTGCVAGSVIANSTGAIWTIPFGTVPVANKRSYGWSRDVLVNTGDRLEDIEMMTSGTKDGDPIDLSLSYWY